MSEKGARFDAASSFRFECLRERLPDPARSDERIRATVGDAHHVVGLLDLNEAETPQPAFRKPVSLANATRRRTIQGSVM